MNELYEEFEYELDKLTRLVVHARENNQSIAENDAIIAQSQKVDALIEKLVRLHQSEDSMPY